MTAWFSAKAQLGNSGVFCSSCASGAPWDTGVIVPQSSLHLVITVTASFGPRTGCVGVCWRGWRKRLCGVSLSVGPIGSAHSSITRGEIDLQLSSSCTRPPWLDQRPTRPSCCPLQERPPGWQQCRLGAGDASVGMTERSVNLIHQTLLLSCLDKHREKYNHLPLNFRIYYI